MESMNPMNPIFNQRDRARFESLLEEYKEAQGETELYILMRGLLNSVEAQSDFVTSLYTIWRDAHFTNWDDVLDLDEIYEHLGKDMGRSIRALVDQSAAWGKIRTVLDQHIPWDTIYKFEPIESLSKCIAHLTRELYEAERSRDYWYEKVDKGESASRFLPDSIRWNAGDYDTGHSASSIVRQVVGSLNNLIGGKYNRFEWAQDNGVFFIRMHKPTKRV